MVGVPPGLILHSFVASGEQRSFRAEAAFLKMIFMSVPYIIICLVHQLFHSAFNQSIKNRAKLFWFSGIKYPASLELKYEKISPRNQCNPNV